MHYGLTFFLINFVGKGCPFFVVYFCFVHMIHLYGYTCLVLKRVANRPSFQECNYEIFAVVCFIVVSVCVDIDDSVPRVFYFPGHILNKTDRRVKYFCLYCHRSFFVVAVFSFSFKKMRSQNYIFSPRILTF